jgi:CBS domain-containing protein
MGARVKDVMTTRVVAVLKNTTFKEITALLTEHRVSAFPVLDEEDQVIGVVSEADLLSKEALVAAVGAQVARIGGVAGSPYHDEFAKAAAVTAADLMSKPAVVITPYEPVTSAARLMYHARVKRLPVVGAKGQLVGIVSRADVLSVYSRPDEEIRREITGNVILNGSLADPDRFTVTVYSGIVTIEGRPETQRQGRDIVAEAWHVEGVVSVRDRLTYPEGRPGQRGGPTSMVRSSCRKEK